MTAIADDLRVIDDSYLRNKSSPVHNLLEAPLESTSTHFPNLTLKTIEGLNSNLNQQASIVLSDVPRVDVDGMPSGYEGMIAVSASTGAGVQALWRAIKKFSVKTCLSPAAITSDARQSKSEPPMLAHERKSNDGLTSPRSNTAVKEHKFASLLRRRYAQLNLHAS